MKVNIFLKYIITNTTTFLINNYKNLSVYNSLYNTNNSKIQIKINNNLYENTYENVVTLANISYNIYNVNNENFIINNFDNYKNISLYNKTVKAYIYGNNDDSINIISFKGTSLHLRHGNDMVGHNDKINDNMFFSCCYYKEVKNFSCKNDRNEENTLNNTCKKECYKETLNNSENYYNISKNIVDTWLSTHENSNNKLMLFTGHSLGGVLATMMGITYNTYAITFEAPGEKHYIDLIGLKYNQSQIEKIYHYGHNADIIFTGKCNGKFSWCNLGGYIIETKCHIGNVCEYDSVNKLNIKESIFTHKMEYVIDNIITKWNNTLPVCEIKNECKDCSKWEYL